MRPLDRLLAIEPESLKIGYNIRPLRLPPLKIAFAAAAVVALLMVFAIQRLPGAQRIDMTPNQLQERFDTAWADANPPKKQDRIVREIDRTRPAIPVPEPTPVTTLRIVPHDPPTMAIAAAAPLPQSAVEEEETPLPRRKLRVASRSGDVCSRHKMRKVFERNGKTWRCRR